MTQGNLSYARDAEDTEERDKEQEADEELADEKLNHVVFGNLATETFQMLTEQKRPIATGRLKIEE